jgi:Fur family ferric uptake transcriptional regulator
MSCEEVFLEKLRQRGFRLTPQREMVLSVMHRIEGSATAEDIHAKVQERSSSVDISTVYRTLELLQQFQLVSSVELPDGLRHYDQLLATYGFETELDHVTIPGLCRECRITAGTATDPTAG